MVANWKRRRKKGREETEKDTRERGNEADLEVEADLEQGVAERNDQDPDTRNTGNIGDETEAVLTVPRRKVTVLIRESTGVIRKVLLKTVHLKIRRVEGAVFISVLIRSQILASLLTIARQQQVEKVRQTRLWF